MRSTLATKQTIGRVRRGTSTKTRSIRFVVRTFPEERAMALDAIARLPDRVGYW